ncbi:hypothetical protein KP001_02195 [Geomonas subterranea]|uniref:Uncharacterized protein n=1 Tax=Geomonas subterranea TaxID=2847989 RepID=A0ABX8LKJ4_9BACT|nr:hypothetical protein [Geomonas subterranea]QXE91377.1 hypothetical protein KP001_02195 [Geomonas subterranea]QXM10536.1 hypothetical protein KP002_05300 [Geomonas subterranea]
MILNPGILSLFAASLLTAIMVLYATLHGVQILRHWDLSSGSEAQLVLERKTYLVATVLSYFLAFQLVSLFLFIVTADNIHHLFVGAMCAVGTLTATPLGYPTLLLKCAGFLLAGLWLVFNHADSLGYDYPLIRTKYLLLLLLAPLLLAEAVLQGGYFLGLSPDIITSCCGSLFSPASRGIATEIANAPPLPMLGIFYLSSALTVGCGLRLAGSGSGGGIFALASALQLVVALVALVSVISLYIYQMPSHHCPFCILQREYGFVGYPIYLAILAAAVSGIGAGCLQRYRNVASLAPELPHLTRRLALVSVSAVLLLAAIVTGYVVFTDFTLR